MLIGNAPVSWGVFEVEHEGSQPPWQRVLDEIAAAGYEGTELGPWGYLPTDTAWLTEELARRRLRLASAFHPIDPRGALATERARAAEVANVLAGLGCDAIVLACAQTDDRARAAGRVTAADGLRGADWTRFVDLVRAAAAAAAEQGLHAFFHHHAATFIETPDEVARLLDAVDVGLCLDSGHYAYGGGEPLEALQRHGDRVGYVHLKDLRRSVLDGAGSFLEAVGAGAFCELGQGDADVEAVVRELERREYAGWLIVEQDRQVTAATPPGEPARAAAASRAFLRRVLGR